MTFISNQVKKEKRFLDMFPLLCTWTQFLLVTKVNETYVLNVSSPHVKQSDLSLEFLKIASAY